MARRYNAPPSIRSMKPKDAKRRRKINTYAVDQILGKRKRK